IGIARAEAELALADLVLWLGPEGEGPDNAWEIEARNDTPGAPDTYSKVEPRHSLSAVTGKGMVSFKADLLSEARNRLPRPGEGALNARQAGLILTAHDALEHISPATDLLLIAENLRQARLSFDKLTGRASTEDMLDTLFSRFCIGK
ncbi:MAG: tRNA uridine-5-carboxymethylaminomethyl(34) synthesis GTPase MnmE, partial [Sphingomonadaceae bacterium]